MALTTKQKLNAVRRIRAHLKDAEGFNPEGGHYKAILRDLATLEKDLAPKPNPKVPMLGPVVPNGKSILMQDLTHETGGVPHHPAFDDAVGHPGLAVIAPEALTIEYIGHATRRDGSPNGRSIHATGASGIHYWIGHVEDVLPVGTKVQKGRKMAVISANHEAPHVHVGVDARKINGGKDLLHHTNYTHGAPLVGVQLAKA